MLLKEEFLDKLTGSIISQKSESNIRRKDFLRVQKDFEHIKSFWGKACFLVFLTLHKNKSIKASGKKLTYKLRTTESAVFKRHIEPFMSEINKEVFVDSKGVKIREKVQERLMEYGEDEFIILCRVIYSAGYNWIKDIHNISLRQHKLQEIQDVY